MASQGQNHTWTPEDGQKPLGRNVFFIRSIISKLNVLVRINYNKKILRYIDNSLNTKAGNTKLTLNLKVTFYLFTTRLRILRLFY